MKKHIYVILVLGIISISSIAALAHSEGVNKELDSGWMNNMHRIMVDYFESDGFFNHEGMHESMMNLVTISEDSSQEEMHTSMIIEQGSINMPCHGG